MNQTLVKFERYCGIGSTRAAKVLGVAYPTYAQYRSARRELPTYHEYHIKVLLMLSREALINVIESRL